MPIKKKSAKLLRCPTCGMLVRFNDEDFPFCSDRCRKIDLGRWLKEEISIPYSEVADDGDPNRDEPPAAEN